jgi:uncharacterized membrane protein YsdA (DUF1294 family)
VIPLWIVGINILAFLAFGYDKLRAIEGKYRIRESTLLGLALIGGSIGALAGQQHFRHKTIKEPFRSQLVAIALLQIALAAAWIFLPDLILPATGRSAMRS